MPVGGRTPVLTAFYSAAVYFTVAAGYSSSATTVAWHAFCLPLCSCWQHVVQHADEQCYVGHLGKRSLNAAGTSWRQLRLILQG
jgi:hypothetical protein